MMSPAKRPLPWWLVPLLLGAVAAQIAVELIAHRAMPTWLTGLSVLLPMGIALDFAGGAGKRRLRARVGSAGVFTVTVDQTAATRFRDLGEGSLLVGWALLVASPVALEFWTEESHPKRVLAIAWEQLAGATVESNDVGRLHTISLQVPGTEPLILDVVRPLHERILRRSATAAEVAAELVARLVPAKAG